MDDIGRRERATTGSDGRFGRIRDRVEGCTRRIGCAKGGIKEGICKECKIKDAHSEDENIIHIDFVASLSSPRSHQPSACNLLYSKLELR